nr:hypothetical protein [Tanacetum cinerariifolium]
MLDLDKCCKTRNRGAKDQVQTPSSQSTAPVQLLVAQSETQTLISEPVVSPVSAPIPKLKSLIPYPSRHDNERRHDQPNEQIKKFYEIFKDMSFEISFTDALILMPKFASTLKALIRNKEKLSEMVRTSMNEHCSVVILNKFPRKLGDPGKFLIPCEFPGMDLCLALANLGASINHMPLSVWEALSLPELTPTCMTLELADRSLSLDNHELPVMPSKYDILNEPSPLGLRLKKSPSLLELIQARLSQANKKDACLTMENLIVDNKKKMKAKSGTLGPVEKLKASNFPAVLLKIGQWEYVSKHEGDLVAKCYFVKHKLVWEVLDCGLKCKIEIQWEDIVGLKANCPDDGPGSLTIVLGRQPLFFKETDPQPRKHTLWQATTDFTNGEASTYRFLSQQLDPVLDLPFASKASVEDQNLSGTSQRSYASASQTSSLQAPRVNANGLVHQDYMEEYGYAESSTLMRQKTMSISDLVNHIGHCISEKKSDQVLPFFENVSSGVDQNDMLQNISQILLNDTYLTTASEEENLMSRVNSLCALLQDVPEIVMDQGWEGDFGMSRNDSFNDFLHHLPRIASLPRIDFDS